MIILLRSSLFASNILNLESVIHFVTEVHPKTAIILVHASMSKWIIIFSCLNPCNVLVVEETLLDEIFTHNLFSH